MKKFELPNNDDVEKILMKNLKHTNPLEMKEKEVSGEKTLFPFWTPVKHDGAETFHDYQEYLTKKDKKLRGDKVGIVEPKSTFKTNANGSIEVKDSYEDYSIIGQMQSVVDKINDTDLGDNTGVVKQKAEFKTSVTKAKGENTIKIEELSTAKMTTASIQSNIDLNVTPHTTTNGNRSNFSKRGVELSDKTGVVKPTSDFKTNKNSSTQSGPTITTNPKIKKGDSFPLTTEPETNTSNGFPSISNEPKPVVNNKTGIVKPQADFDVDISGIDFKRFMK